MKKTAVFLGVLLCFCSLSVTAQNQANIWYFGWNAGLDFSSVDITGKPTVLSDGALYTMEGCSVISDEAGKLLFYTDGDTVWNRQHQLMPNGAGLYGDHSSTQAALIVPQPGSERYFYIFTTDAQAQSKGLNYSIVDMNAAGGFGDVTTKNIQLYTPTTEKLTAVHHANGKDVWVITHKWKSDEFYVYLITEEGLHETPIISRAGTVHEWGGSNANTLGQMKAAPSGKSIALTIHEIRRVELFNFSNQTGDVSYNHAFQVKIDTSFNVNPYGVEFSPNEKYLYIGEAGTPAFSGQNIHQYEISSGRITAIDTVYLGGSLQLAVDNKVYAVEAGRNELLVLERPNLPADHPEFTTTRLSIAPGISTYGLPSFIQSYFYVPDAEVVMPNVITPNGDDLNERFEPKVFRNIEMFSLHVYNRLGKQIFYTDNTADRWWGGEGHPSGVYYWHLRYEGVSGKEGSLKGWVQVLR
ncbi:T9SS type B sorting domain-containing protein [Nafulsella turpanensis]|uniref:T9SS type B sorting domain-containing protein n=1 Tax=Nafulsella turpanensis TaxID=1265690 RepID=UPI0003458DD2|nr:gliding motility-associated C-terminal domain-containing protein [Nafulsella turpanensis]